MRRSLFHYCLFHNMANIGVTLIRNNAFRIIIHFSLTFGNVFLQVSKQLRTDAQFFLNHFVAFKQLDSIPAEIIRLHHSLNGFFNMRQRVFNTSGKNVGKRSTLSCFCQFHRSAGSLRTALTFQRADLQHFAAQSLPQLFQIDGIPILADQINHIDGNHHRVSQFNQLSGQVEIPLNICSVNDIQDSIRALLDQICTGHNLLRRIGRQRINARKILERYMLKPFQRTLLFFHGNPRPVTHILIGSCQRIKQGRLSAVWISGQRYFDFHDTYAPSSFDKRCLTHCL